EIPVAELVPGELVERARRVVEAILLDAGAGARRRPGELADRPAIDDLARRFRVERRIQIAAVQLAKARRVPQLGAEVAITLHPAFAQLDVAALDHAREQGEAQ